jgi:hypothetical protein
MNDKITTIKIIPLAYISLLLLNMSCFNFETKEAKISPSVNIDSIVAEKMKVEKAKADSLLRAKMREEEILKAQKQADDKTKCNNSYQALKSTIEGFRDISNSQNYYVFEDRIKKWDRPPIYFNAISKIKIRYNRGEGKGYDIRIYDYSNAALIIFMNSAPSNRTVLYKVAKNMIQYLKCKYNKEMTVQFDVDCAFCESYKTDSRNREEAEKMRTEFNRYQN